MTSDGVNEQAKKNSGTVGIGVKPTTRGNCIMLKVSVSRFDGPIAVETHSYRLTVDEAERTARHLVAAVRLAGERREQYKEQQQ